MNGPCHQSPELDHIISTVFALVPNVGLPVTGIYVVRVPPNVAGFVMETKMSTLSTIHHLHRPLSLVSQVSQSPDLSPPRKISHTHTLTNHLWCHSSPHNATLIDV